MLCGRKAVLSHEARAAASLRLACSVTRTAIGTRLLHRSGIDLSRQEVRGGTPMGAGKLSDEPEYALHVPTWAVS